MSKHSFALLGKMTRKSILLRKKWEKENKHIVFNKKFSDDTQTTTTKTTTLTKSGRIGLTALIKIIEEKNGL